jgi:outer membrane protein assembly factor BamB
MVFDNSYNFSYIGDVSQNWVKPPNIENVTFILSGGGGGGSASSSSGGGGAYVYANYYPLDDTSYNVVIYVGGGGQAPPIQSGGISVGGYVDPSGIIQSDGGAGSTLSGASSGGGGGLTSIFYTDTFGNEAIYVVAGGGGGGGTISGANGGASGTPNGTPIDINGKIYSSLGANGSGVGGGQGGNSTFYGNAGLGGTNGGVNGNDYVDASHNNPYNYIGGGGGGGGTFAGGGGGAGYGGAAGGKYGGGGGGGSLCINSSFMFFTLGGGGAGGSIGQSGGNGSVTIYWNDYQPIILPVIVQEFMLNPQHTCKSSFKAPSLQPASVRTFNFAYPSVPKLSCPSSAVIGNDSNLYIVAGDGKVYGLLGSTFAAQWPPFSYTGYTFFGTPIITTNGTLYVSARTTVPSNAADGYFFALATSGTVAASKWLAPFKLNELGDNPSTSPISDASGNIYFGTQNGSIYALHDETAQALLGWDLSNVSVRGVPVTGTPVFDISYTKLCYTTNDYVNKVSTLYALDVSKNSVMNHIVPTLRWSATATSNTLYGTPSYGAATGAIYVASEYLDPNDGSGGFIYAYDISNGAQLWSPIPINDVSFSNIAVNDSHIYFTTQNYLNTIDISFGALQWRYPIDPSGASAPDNSTPIIDASNNIIFGARNNYLYSIRPATRSSNWRYEVGGAIEAMPIIGNNENIYVPANNAVFYDLSGNSAPTPTSLPIVPMYMLDVKHSGISPYLGPVISSVPSIYWSADFVCSNLFVLPSIAIGTGSGSISNDGTLYIGSDDGYVYAYTLGQPAPKWHVRVSAATNAPLTSPNSLYTSPVVAPDGTIYIGSNQGYLYALEPTNGGLKWQYNAGYPLQSSPILDGSGSIYFGAGNNVYALGDAGYAAYPKWLNVYYPTGSTVNSSPALSSTGFLYFGSNDGFLYAVDSVTGTLKAGWPVNLSNADPSVPPIGGVHPIYTSPAVDASNNVIIGTGSYMNGVLCYLDGITGTILWAEPYDANIGPFYNTVAIHGDTIFLSTIAYVYAINRLTGVKKWYYYNTNFYYTSLIVDANGTLYFASIKAEDDPNNGPQKQYNGILHCVTDTGSAFQENWSMVLCTTGRLATPVIGTNKTIYISGTSNKVYAIR